MDHPQTNLTLHVNRGLKAIIASYIGEKHKTWDKYLPVFSFALNTIVHEFIGVTLAELNMNQAIQDIFRHRTGPKFCICKFYYVTEFLNLRYCITTQLP